MILKAICFLVAFEMAQSVITDRDLQYYLGVDVKKAKNVTWKDWINLNPQINPARGPPIPQCLELGVNKTLGQCCNNDTALCDQSKQLVCNFLGVCTCKLGYFLNAALGKCEFWERKELGQRCGVKDNCYAAFASCIRNKCACKDGFVRSGTVCEPKEYDCPFKTAIKSKGSIISCRINSTTSECPKGSWCLEPIPEGDRVKFFTTVKASSQAKRKGDPTFRYEQAEMSYCCPSVPQFSVGTVDPSGLRQRVFQEVCLYGKPFNTNTGPCPIDSHYWSPGIGAGLNCCPLPCLAHPTGLPVVRDGKCATV